MSPGSRLMLVHLGVIVIYCKISKVPSLCVRCLISRDLFRSLISRDLFRRLISRDLVRRLISMDLFQPGNHGGKCSKQQTQLTLLTHISLASILWNIGKKVRLFFLLYRGKCISLI